MNSTDHKSLCIDFCAAGFEPATTCFQGKDSTKLSYAQLLVIGQAE
jgi:hypothetical protein